MFCGNCRDRLAKTIEEFTSATYTEKEADKIVLSEVRKDLNIFVVNESERILKRLNSRFENLRKETIEKYLVDQIEKAIGEHATKVRSKAE